MKVTQNFIWNCQETLKEFAPNSARTCVTSPPYYGLRDYGTTT